MPKIEVGFYMYRPGWAENIGFPVVVKRTFKPYARIPAKKRAEMIKEDKIAFDLRHFPCRKMKANHAYALLGMLAHNFFRLIAWLDQPRYPQFAKALRYRFIHIPGRIVKGQRKLKLRIPEPHNQEVETLVTRWVETFKPPRSTA